ncbi:hypothetical protein CK203_046885 [Vitis vinifera]|uniref:Uncharacterized protein n=1 Tax=Vitis vinifera TaxID=29760 RepID=A0A438HE53_VITVI|nr:hypothetical protein CK203_046885 [Vitis vinifera]
MPQSTQRTSPGPAWVTQPHKDFIYLSSDSATSRPTFGKQPAGKHRRTLLARGLDLLEWLDQQPPAQSSMSHLEASQFLTKPRSPLVADGGLGTAAEGSEPSFCCLLLKPTGAGTLSLKEEEIKNKVDELLIDEKFKARAMELKEMTALNVKEGGKSHSNLKNFIEWIKS